MASGVHWQPDSGCTASSVWGCLALALQGLLGVGVLLARVEVLVPGV